MNAKCREGFLDEIKEGKNYSVLSIVAQTTRRGYIKKYLICIINDRGLKAYYPIEFFDCDEEVYRRIKEKRFSREVINYN